MNQKQDEYLPSSVSIFLISNKISFLSSVDKNSWWDEKFSWKECRRSLSTTDKRFEIIISENGIFFTFHIFVWDSSYRGPIWEHVGNMPFYGLNSGIQGDISVTVWLWNHTHTAVLMWLACVGTGSISSSQPDSKLLEGRALPFPLSLLLLSYCSALCITGTHTSKITC